MKKTIVIASILVILGALCGCFVGWTVGKADHKCENLSADKEYFSVLICPAGRGSTPKYVLEVYEGDKLIKSVEFFEMRKDIF